MTTEPTASVLTAGTAARVLATGLAGAALSAERHPTLMRSVGWVLAAGAGCFVGLGAAGVLPKGAQGGATLEVEQKGLPPIAAAGLGAAVFAMTGATSEAGVWAQRRFERWADAAFGRPRLAVGLATGALALLVDVADERQRVAERGREAGVTSGA